MRDQLFLTNKTLSITNSDLKNVQSVTDLVLKVLGIDNELVGGLLWRSKVHEADVTCHFLHSVSVQLDALEFFASVVVRHIKSESQRLHLKQEQNH